MKRKWGAFCRFFLLLLSALLLLGGCAQDEKSADTILSALMGAGEDSLPEGEIYRSGAEEGSEDYPPSALLRALYGEDGEESIRICDFSIYLSAFAVPLEIAVFRAPSGDHARRIYALCLSRMDLLKVALRETEFDALGGEICVYRAGRYVVMGVTWNQESFLKAVKKEIG